MGDACHQECYTKTKLLIDRAQISEETFKVIIFRCKLNAPDIEKVTNICNHHKAKYSYVFESKVKDKCRNIFKTHLKTVKGGRPMSLAICEKLVTHGYDVMPGWHLCRNCWQRAVDLVDHPTTDQESDYHVTSDDRSKSDNIAIANKANESLAAMGCSPINLHAVPTQSRIHYAKEKLDKTIAIVKNTVAEVMQVDVTALPCASGTSIQLKADALDKLMAEIKEQIPLVDYREKIQLLTLIPDFWSVNEAAKYFNVKRYSIEKARLLKKERGINKLPDANAGCPLSQEVIKRIEEFYQNDEYSRLMPGNQL